MMEPPASDGREGCDVYDLCNRYDIELKYENVPEPRRPREWVLVENEDSSIAVAKPAVLYDTHSSRFVRVIEWPIDAPLPEWPE